MSSRKFFWLDAIQTRQARQPDGLARTSGKRFFGRRFRVVGLFILGRSVFNRRNGTRLSRLLSELLVSRLISSQNRQPVRVLADKLKFQFDHAPRIDRARQLFQWICLDRNNRFFGRLSCQEFRAATGFLSSGAAEVRARYRSLKLRFCQKNTPKALHPIAWGQPLSGATPGPVHHHECTLKGFHEMIAGQCNPFGVVVFPKSNLGWRRCAADPRLLDETPSA